MIKGWIEQEETVILNVYMSNNRVKIHEAKTIEFQGKINESTIRIGYIIFLFWYQGLNPV